MIDELNEQDETQEAIPSDDAALQNSDGTTTGSEASQTDESAEAEAFDPSVYEQSFGLPAGSLKDVTSADEATATIRQFIDRTLIASTMQGFSGGADVPETKAAETKKAPKIEDLAARLERAEKQLEQEAKAREKQYVDGINRRVLSRVDTWDSSKYGTSKARNYNQLTALNELRKLAVAHTQSLIQMGNTVTDDMLEVILDRARLFHDESFKPGATKKADGAAPLGTPGGRKSEKASKAPANIHEALMRSPR